MEIWYQQCYCVDSVKCGLFSKSCFKERNNMAVGKAPKVMINFYKKQCLPVITRKKEHSSKQAVLITYTLVKKFFAAATFKGL